MTLLVIGLVVGGLGILGWSATDSDANACRNALVGAFDNSQCTTITFWHDVSGVAVIAAGVVVGFILYQKYKGKGSTDVH